LADSGKAIPDEGEMCGVCTPDVTRTSMDCDIYNGIVGWEVTEPASVNSLGVEVIQKPGNLILSVLAVCVFFDILIVRPKNEGDFLISIGVLDALLSRAFLEEAQPSILYGSATSSMDTDAFVRINQVLSCRHAAFCHCEKC
jgi:hypothetical protein